MCVCVCVRFVAGARQAFCGHVSVAMRLLIVCCLKRGHNAVLLHLNRFENRYNIYWWCFNSVRAENKYVCQWLA